MLSRHKNEKICILFLDGFSFYYSITWIDVVVWAQWQTMHLRFGMIFFKSSFPYQQQTCSFSPLHAVYRA